MGNLNDTTGKAIPFFVDDFHLEDISAANFDPITNEADAENVALLASQIENWYGKRGFLVRPDTAGNLYAVTWRQYKNAQSAGMTFAQKQTALAALLPKQFLAAANTWVECPVVKVYSSADQTYPSASDNINVGKIL